MFCTQNSSPILNGSFIGVIKDIAIDEINNLSYFRVKINNEFKLERVRSQYRQKKSHL